MVLYYRINGSRHCNKLRKSYPRIPPMAGQKIPLLNDVSQPSTHHPNHSAGVVNISSPDLCPWRLGVYSFILVIVEQNPYGRLFGIGEPLGALDVPVAHGSVGWIVDKIEAGRGEWRDESLVRSYRCHSPGAKELQRFIPEGMAHIICHDNEILVGVKAVLNVQGVIGRHERIDVVHTSDVGDGSGESPPENIPYVRLIGIICCIAGVYSGVYGTGNFVVVCGIGFNGGGNGAKFSLHPGNLGTNLRIEEVRNCNRRENSNNSYHDK